MSTVGNCVNWSIFDTKSLIFQISNFFVRVLQFLLFKSQSLLCWFFLKKRIGFAMEFYQKRRWVQVDTNNLHNY